MGLAAACMLLGVNASQAAVTLTFEQSGSNVIATWSGDYDLPAISQSSPAHLAAGSAAASGRALVLDGDAYRLSFGGVASVTSVVETYGSFTGDTFGFNGSSLSFPEGVSGTYSPVGTMTFANTTLAAMGADSFSNTLAYSGSNNVGGSSEIRFTTSAVPEPTSALLCGLGAFAMATRRRRNA